MGSQSNPVMKLEQWSLVLRPAGYGAGLYRAPEQGATQHLHGNVSGHPRVTDGQTVTTSRVVGQHDGKVVTESGGLYDLGTVAPGYDAAYPGARERFFGTAPQVSPDPAHHTARHAEFARFREDAENDC